MSRIHLAVSQNHWDLSASIFNAEYFVYNWCVFNLRLHTILGLYGLQVVCSVVMQDHSWKVSKFARYFIKGYQQQNRYMEFQFVSLIYSLLGNTQFIREQNDSKLQFLGWIGQFEKIFCYFFKFSLPMATSLVASFMLLSWNKEILLIKPVVQVLLTNLIPKIEPHPNSCEYFGC